MAGESILSGAYKVNKDSGTGQKNMVVRVIIKDKIKWETRIQGRHSQTF